MRNKTSAALKRSGNGERINGLERLEEQTIIQKVMEGDADAFEALVLANQKNVYNLALKMTNNEEDALDISQEAFLKAYSRIGTYRGESRFSVWLYRLTYNLCIDFLRKKPNTSTVPLMYQDDSGEEHEFEIPDFRATPEDETILRENRKIINESFNELDTPQRELLMMREITGMSYLDIAVVLNISEGTVKSRIFRARKKLTAILIEKGTFPDGYRLKDEVTKEVAEHE